MNDEYPIVETGEVELQDVKTEGMSFGARVIGVLVSPFETMQDLAERPRILFPIVLMALATPLMFLSRYSLYESYLLKTMNSAMSVQNVQMPAGQLEAMMEWLPMVSIISAPFGALLSWLVVTGIIFGLVKAFKGAGSFKQYLSVTGYAYVITALFCLVSVIVSFFSGEIIFNSSLAVVVPGLKGSYLYGILRSIELFALWNFIVTGIGVFVVSKLSWQKAAIIVGGIYVVNILISAYSARSI